MCLICVFMSMSLVQSVSRINKLESEVVTVKQTVDKQREETRALAEDMSNYSPVITVMAAQNEQPVKERKYTIKEGDTLVGICRLFYGDDKRLEEIIAINDITNPNRIF